MTRWLWLPLLVSCAPAWPDGAALTAARVTGTTVELRWPPATHGGGIDTYRVQRGEAVLTDALAGNVTRFVAGGLDDGAAYEFSVQACAVDGRWSAPLRLEVATPDVTPPQWTQPTRFVVTVESETETSARLLLSWGNVEDNIGVHELIIYHRPAEPITLPGATREHAVESVTPDGIWQVEAKDRAGNGSQVLSTKVETEHPARRTNRAGRVMDVFAGRDKRGNVDLFGPAGPGVPLERPVGPGPGPVWLGNGGDERGRAWATSKLGALERCYVKARESDPALQGRLAVSLVVDAAGQVNTSRMDGLKPASLRSCVRVALHGRLQSKPESAFRTDIVVNMTASAGEGGRP